MAVLQIRDHKREELILELRDKGCTYKEIAEQLNVTKARVGQIYRRVVKEKNLMIKCYRKVS